MTNYFLKFFQAIEHFFHNPKVQQAFDTVASIITNAGVEQIVKDIELLVPNQTVQQIVAVYTKYAVPVSEGITNGTVSPGNALLNLATVLVQKKVPNTTAVNLIQTAIQTVVTAVKASEAV